MKKRNTFHRVLYIDLDKNAFKIRNREELFKKYIGGTGVAIQLLYEECPEGIDPLSPEAPIVMAIGPLTGVFPLASKTVALFKSPLTGNLGESHVGGRSAVAIRMAGFGAIVIKGKSRNPVYLSIHDDKVFFKDATTIWQMSSSFTAGRIIRQKEDDSGLRSIMRIGQAGENMVSYAAVTTETYRHFGRMGLGAVFGSKMIKGINISGKSSIDVEDRKSYRKLYKTLYDAAVDSPLMKKYHDLGTAGNVLTLNELDSLPTKNLRHSRLEGVEKISGEHLAKHFLGRRVACAHCPVGCIHLAAVREPSEHEEHFYKTTMVGYDFELIFALGSMLGISDPEVMLKLIDQVEKYGVDAMSIGVCMAWATEMFMKKKITTEHTDGLNLKWGDGKTYEQLVKKIVLQENDFYKALAKGAEYAAEQYGGKGFAMSFGKNEMAGYHTGPAAYLGFLIGARHSHLDNAGYSLDQTEMINNPITSHEVVDKLIKEEGLRQLLSSLTVCFFSRGIYKIDVIKDTLKEIGLDLSVEELNKIGEQIYLDKYRFKFREGFEFDKLHVPERIYETPDLTGLISPEFIKEGLSYAETRIKESIG
ncbi:MAG: aldehyde:ferredoxin oxidoreductase [Bacteroidetes bacterium]|nr:aldehyde:ferredoxin oxidoreductase [Bacteroidota bacterium]